LQSIYCRCSRGCDPAFGEVAADQLAIAGFGWAVAAATAADGDESLTGLQGDAAAGRDGSQLAIAGALELAGAAARLAAADAERRIHCAVAGEPGLDGGIDRAEFADPGGRAALAAGAFGIRQDAPAQHANGITQLVDLDAIEVAEAEITNVHGGEPGVGPRRAG